MTLEASLYSALGSLVGNRVAPEFPQPPAVPTWPAIRYSIETLAVIDICGDGSDETAETTVILDIVALTYTAARALRQQVLTAMKTFDPPTIAGFGRSEYDVDTKTFREIQEFTIHGSTSS
jgi:Protein of unknown function (DUF3168)